MTVRIYVRASTKEQDAERALSDLVAFSSKYGSESVTYVENYSGTKLSRPKLNKLLKESQDGDILLVESVDRLSRLNQDEFDVLKKQIKDKGLRLVIADLPTTYMLADTSDVITSTVLNLINNMLIDLLATMAKLDNDKRIERIKQGLQRSGYKPKGKTADTAKHDEIIELLNDGKYTKVKIAKMVGCSEQQIYKIAKKYSDRIKPQETTSTA